MKKLMKIAVVISLNLFVLNFTVSQLLSSVTSRNEVTLRGPASSIKAVPTNLNSKKSFAFNYKDLTKKPFQIKKEAFSYEEAFKSASHECFEQLTGGKYPGEEKGLDIIDICANPKT